jgi:RimJ/RimL family protein N-acetyltransferase
MASIRKATKDDGSFILEVRNHESTLKFLHDPRVFLLDDFENWFETNKPEWFIIENNNNKVGYIRTKWIVKNDILQVGADIHPEQRGFGYSKMAYYQLFERFKNVKKFVLEVFDDNVIAKNLYDKLGFVFVEKYKIGDRESVVMEKINE